MSIVGIVGLGLLVAALVGILLFGRKVLKDQSGGLTNALVFFVVGGIYAMIIVWIGNTFLLAYSSFSMGLGKTILALFLVWLFDRIAVKEIDTMKLLEGNAIAYSIFLLGVFILAGVCIATS